MMELLPFLIAAFATYISIVLLHPFALSSNLTDKPSKRKLHEGSIPLTGGIAMFVGIIIGTLLLPIDLNNLKYFLLTSLIIVSVGVLDDHKDITVVIRLFFQVLVSILIISGAGLSIYSFGNILGNGEILLNGWAYFLTVILIIASINAVNMADGINGLAAGNSLITFLAILFLAYDSINQHGILIALLFCSVLPVFMMHNLCILVKKSKRIFMGDAGSMFIGIGIIWLLIEMSQGESRAFNPVIAAWLFAGPIFEMSGAIVRRVLAGTSPFKPDALHSHHILMQLGIKSHYVLLILLFFSLLMAVIGILGTLYDVADWVMFVGFLLIFLVYLLSYRIAVRRLFIKKN